MKIRVHGWYRCSFLILVVCDCRVKGGRRLRPQASMGHLGAKILSVVAPLAVPAAMGASIFMGVPFSVSLITAAACVGAVFCAALATADADLRLLSLGKYKTGAFEGKVAVIVGASSGIGAALAGYLAKQGAVLVLSSRGKEQLQVRDKLLVGYLVICRVPLLPQCTNTNVSTLSVCSTHFAPCDVFPAQKLC